MVDIKSLTLRDIRQEEWAQKWLKTKFGILYICPRGGKIKTSINCFRSFDNPKILIIYPIQTIKDSWEKDFISWDYDSSNVTYSTTASLWKLAEKPEFYDIIVVDEIHMLSEANLNELKVLIDYGNKVILGLSGTISDETRYNIYDITKLPILAYYSIEQGVKEKVITNYEITVILVDLDNKVKHIKLFKNSKFEITELKAYNDITSFIDKLKEDGKNTGLLPIQRMHILKKSISKLNMTKRLIDKFKKERVLVFCGVTEIADKLGIPVYHSKNKDNKLKEDFCNGVGNHMATVDMFEAGVTIKPINRAILNSFDSNPENLSQRISRLTGFEYENENKIAKIYIIATETIELKWLRKAFEFFDDNKIKYIKII